MKKTPTPMAATPTTDPTVAPAMVAALAKELTTIVPF